MTGVQTCALPIWIRYVKIIINNNVKRRQTTLEIILGINNASFIGRRVSPFINQDIISDSDISKVVITITFTSIKKIQLLQIKKHIPKILLKESYRE